MQKIVVLIAPHSPDGAAQNLGAAKKIELVVSLLNQLGFDIHYVDSAHPPGQFCAPILGRESKLGQTPIRLWRPFCIPNRKLGKLLNIIFSPSLFKALKDLNPALVWVYNSYAFEARLGLYLKRTTKCKLVLELEDMPMARSRGINPKPLLDGLFFKPLLAEADLVTFVNAALMHRFDGKVSRSLLFPSILQNALVQMPEVRRFTSHQYKLGYFGGLETDKGVEVLMDLLPLMPADWKVVITGVGSLAPRLEALAKKYPAILDFRGAVTHEQVLSLMQGCDAIVNPHTPISSMGDGVFPFKVCEALASGAVLISTELPSIDMDLSKSVKFFDGSVVGLADALKSASAHYFHNIDSIAKTRMQVCQSYGEASVQARFRQSMKELLPT